MDSLRQQLLEEEIGIVRHLKRDLCYRNGKERNPKESAKALHKLGLIYMKYGLDCGDLVDKICLIRSAGLLNAAIAREPENVENVRRDLKKLCTDLLHVAGADKADADLIEIATLIKDALKEMRAKVHEELKRLKHIPENETDEEKLTVLEEEKVKLVMEMQENVTKEYTRIMDMAANNIEIVMGKRPCEFVVAGMGSLARKEITPYSDFEHVIVLEEGVQECGDYEMVLNYFRWFTTIFHVTLINMQETLIRTLNIPSLNGEEDDWFFDAYTTGGVTFDGMVSHACKFPLGRWFPTDEKKFTTELIKPLSQMVSYLDRRESVKNGYYLADVLTKTCFVSGNKELYDQFQNAVQKKIAKIEVTGEVKRQVSDNFLCFHTRANLLEMIDKRKFDIKRTMYRTTTVFISALGRIFKLKEAPCFDIIETLAKEGVCSTKFKQKLKYAVAVACELRLKIYMKKGSQDDRLNDHVKYQEKAVQTIIDAVGRKSIIDYFRIAYCLQYDMQNILQIKVVKFYFTFALLIINISWLLRMLQKVPSEILIDLLYFKVKNEFDEEMKLVEVVQGKDFLGKAYLHLSICDVVWKIAKCDNYTLMGKTEFHSENINSTNEQTIEASNTVGDVLYLSMDYEEALEQYSVALRHIEDIRSCKTTACNSLSDVGQKNDHQSDLNELEAGTYERMASCLFKLDKYAECLEYAMKLLSLRQHLSANSNYDEKMANSYKVVGTTLIALERYSEALPYLEQCLDVLERLTGDSLNRQRNIALTYTSISQCMIGLDNHSKALKTLEKSIEILKQTSVNEDKDKALASTYNTVGDCFSKIGQYGKALEHFQKMHKIIANISENDERNKDLAKALQILAGCLGNLYRYSESLEYHLKALNIKQHLSANLALDDDIAHSYYGIAKCLLNLNKKSEAEVYAEKALSIGMRVTKDDKKKLAKYYAEYASILYELPKHVKSLQYYKKALAIQKTLLSDEEFDTQLAWYYHGVGLCLQALQKNEQEAVKYLKQALSIRLKLSKDPDKTRKIATSYNDIGNSLNDLNKNEEGLQHFRKAIAILKRTTEDEDRDELLGDVLNNFGSCLLAQGASKEALECYEKALQIRKNITENEDCDWKVAAIYSGRASCLSALYRKSESLESYQKALGIFRKSSVDECNDILVARTCNSFGIELSNSDNVLQALKYHQQALDILKVISATGAYQRDLAATYENVGCCFRRLHMFTEALPFFQKCVDLRRSSSANEANEKDLAAAYYNFANCMTGLNRISEALEYHQKALGIRKSIATDEKKDEGLAHSYNAVGECFSKLNKPEECLRNYNKALDIFMHISIDHERDENVGTMYNNIAAALLSLKQFNESLTIFKKALNIRKVTSSKQIIAETYSNVGSCLEGLNKYSDALEHFQQAKINFEHSESVESERYVALSYNKMGFCLFLLDRIPESLLNYQKEFELLVKLSPDKEQDGKLAQSYRSMGLCHIRLKCLEEALDCLVKSQIIQNNISYEHSE
ncbi:unnamed protein product [Clavelina lepadiformis]|uniref:Protein-PII uridylyltransferase N-terminal domain-containing protein n=1 Tax=Clavelina lepadiformis TaxID=159417 RepID=A0ABP0G1M1_CLALP